MEWANQRELAQRRIRNPIEPGERSVTSIRMWNLLWQLDEAKERALRWLQPSRMTVPYTWPLRPDNCPCDVHLCEYVEERGIRGRSIFHFGTGLHHLVGLRNSERGWQNEILAVTASPREHLRYVHRVVRDHSLGKHYKVLFADIYDLDDLLLPTFDLVTLFHLCEFTPTRTAATRLADGGVLALFVAKLATSGRILFYQGSDGFGRTEPLIRREVEVGRLSFEERYKSLVVYRASCTTLQK
jgi:hypothetical protein